MKRLLSFFSKGHKRSILAKKNIAISFFVKFLTMFIMFALVSKSIEYLGKEAYGLWVLLSAGLAWISLFDFGLTNGLRNKLSEALAHGKNDTKLYKSMVSTTYALVFIISIFIYLIVLIAINIFDWKTIFSVTQFTNNEIRTLLMLIFFAFSLNLLLKPIDAVLNAIQWPSISMIFALLSSIISILSLYFLPKGNIYDRLYIYTIVISFTPIIILLLSSIYLYATKLNKFRPNFSSINFGLSKQIKTLGISFFLIQFAGLVISQTDNFIIAYLYGPKSVAEFNIVYKYFSVYLMAVSIILTPFWSAFTEAYVKKEFDWIKGSIKKLTLIFAVMSIFVYISIIFSNEVYKLWINREINIQQSISIAMGIYTIVYAFANLFVFFVNGVGYIRVQMYSGIFMALLNIPLSYFFAHTLGYGVPGVIASTIICAAIPGFFSYIQYKKIINGIATGVWVK